MLLGVDVGGTFTDAVLLAPDGTVHTAKVPTSAAEQSEGVMAAVALALAAAGAPGGRVQRFAHGMTVATNALLEGRTARTALIATEGFTDVIELARQNRAHLYRLCEAAPAPLVPAELRFAAPERVAPEGVLRRLDPAAARGLVRRVRAARPEAVAVCLLHSYAEPAHELLLGRLVRELLPGAALSLSSELVGTFREYERTATTALDASLSPLLASYLSRLARRSRELGLPVAQVMQSSGGLTDSSVAARHGALTVLSGPAGGAAGAALLAERSREPRLLCLDMGGTSCDVCVVEDGGVRESAERSIAGRPLALPSLDIHTVGAGGGSIAWRDPGGALRVGPASAGAEPGPACYGRGGRQPTVTDANLLLGRLLEDAPLAGGVRLSRAAAERAVGTLASALAIDLLACAEGIVRIAEAEMLGALRVMTLQRGVDPRGFALLAFGGAGPLHAAALAEQLGIERVLCPRSSGVLSALGLAAAAPRVDVSRSLLLGEHELDAVRLEHERARLASEALRRLGSPATRVRIRHELRYAGQSFELAIDEELAEGGLDRGQLRERFEHAHEQRYGYRDAEAALEHVTMRASAWGAAPALAAGAGKHSPARRTSGRIVFGGHELQAAILRGEPAAQDRVDGPALCALPHATLLVPPGWSGESDDLGTVVISRTGPSAAERRP